MGCIAVSLTRLDDREYPVGQDSVLYDSAKLDFDPDFDSDEINFNIHKTPLVAEFSFHQFADVINSSACVMLIRINWTKCLEVAM